LPHEEHSAGVAALALVSFFGGLRARRRLFAVQVHRCRVYSIGIWCFSAISVELYYIFATVWGHETYTLFYILLIVFIILLTVVACVSVALTYFQLAGEDYRWWWRSVIVGGFVYLLIIVLKS
jgi:hypothetical protein